MLKWLNKVLKLEFNSYKMKPKDYKEIFKIRIDILNVKLVIRKMNGQKFMEIKSKL